MLVKRQRHHPQAIRPLSHTGDVGFRLWGATQADIFIHAAQALYGVITDRRKIRARTRREIVVAAPDPEALLVEWLNELLFLLDTDAFLGRRIEIQELTATRVRAIVSGEEFDPRRHELKAGVKAATYHQVALQPVAGGWEGRIILDI